MEPLIKNLPHAQPFPLKDQVGYEPGKVVSLTLAQRPGVGMTLFAFDAGEAISTHAAPGDAMATILEGTAQITIDGVPHTLNAGEAALYRVNTALGSKAGKALDRETRTKIKEAERTLERVLKHKKADKLTPVDVNAINTAREALSAVAAPLVARWESEKA